MFRILIIGLFTWLAALTVTAQETLPEAIAVQKALSNNGNIQAAALQVKQQQQLLKSVAGYNSTSLLVEQSPYESMQMAVEQQFEWPGVYSLRRNAQQQRIELARKQQQLTSYEITKLVKETYLQVQYLESLLAQLSIQDSLYGQVAIAAKRNFNAGQVNKLEEQFANNQYLVVHNNYSRTTADFIQWKTQLNILIGDTTSFTIQPLRPFPISMPVDSTNNRILDLLQQQVKLSEAELKTTRAENRPGFITGLIFPLEKPYQQLPGFRAGISIPLFAGQNKSRVEAAQTGIAVSRAQLAAQQQQFNWQLSNAWQTIQKEKKSLDLYQSDLLKNADEIIQTALRFFSAGEMGYIEALRNVANGFETKINYLQTTRDYNQAIIEYNYLKGIL